MWASLIPSWFRYWSCCIAIILDHPLVDHQLLRDLDHQIKELGRKVDAFAEERRNIQPNLPSISSVQVRILCVILFPWHSNSSILRWYLRTLIFQITTNESETWSLNAKGHLSSIPPCVLLNASPLSQIKEIRRSSSWRTRRGTGWCSCTWGRFIGENTRIRGYARGFSSTRAPHGEYTGTLCFFLLTFVLFRDIMIDYTHQSIFFFFIFHLLFHFLFCDLIACCSRLQPKSNPNHQTFSIHSERTTANYRWSSLLLWCLPASWISMGTSVLIISWTNSNLYLLRLVLFLQRICILRIQRHLGMRLSKLAVIQRNPLSYMEILIDTPMSRLRTTNNIT